MKTSLDLRWERRQKAAQRRRSVREQAVAYKGGRCEICGYDKCLNAMELHHLDPMEKDFTISDRMTSFEAIRRELDKCVLLCSNCHREVHDGWHPQFIVYEDSEPRGQLDLGDDFGEYDAVEQT